MKSLRGRVAVVTGAANGVGEGIATVLAREGAQVAIADIDAEGAERLAAKLEADGLEAAAFAVDLVDRASVDGMAGAILDHWGSIDLLAANAGAYPEALVEDLTDEILHQIMDLNVLGAVHSIQACLPTMRSRRYGRIVLTSSITGPYVAAEGYAGYGASKAALLGLMRGVALEVCGDEITVNAILPGNVRTSGFEALTEPYKEKILRAIPMRRLAEPEELGWAVRYLASEEAGYVTGQTLILDGGQVLPEGAS